MIYEREVATDTATALARLRAALAEHGFGVLWEFSIADKLKEKGVTYDGEHHILEVCNPHDAKRALTAEPTVAYFLPCKLLVYRRGSTTVVGLPRPTVMLGSTGAGALMPLATEVESRLRAAVDSV